MIGPHGCDAPAPAPLSPEQIWEAASCRCSVLSSAALLHALRRMGFSEGAVDGVFELLEALPFIVTTQDMDYIDLRDVCVNAADTKAVLKLFEQSRAAVERMLAAQGDAAEPELVQLQHELTEAAAMRRKFLTQK